MQTIVLFVVIGPSGQIFDCYVSLSSRQTSIAFYDKKNGDYLNCPWYF